MADPAWSSSPPEVNHLRLVGGGAGGTATTLAAATAWQTLLGCHETAFSVSTVNTAATALDFEGVGGASSGATATALNSALQLLAGWVQEKVPIATAAVSAYDTAVSAMIPAAVSIANRTEQAADVAMNPLVFGALTPAIVALDVEYFGEHWPHNASAGIAYGTALAALAAALTVPPPAAPLGASPAAPVTAAAAVAETAGQVAAGEVMKESAGAARAAGDGTTPSAEAAGGLAQVGSMMSAPAQAAMGALQPAMAMLQTPLQSLQGLTGVPQSLGGLLNPVSEEDLRQEGELPAALTTPGTGGGENGAPRAGLTPGGVPPAGGTVAGGGAAPALTSYTRPAGGFTPEVAGRPTGLLSATTAAQGPTTSTGGGLPLSPATGMLGTGRGNEKKSETAHARVAFDTSRNRR